MSSIEENLRDAISEHETIKENYVKVNNTDAVYKLDQLIKLLNGILAGQWEPFLKPIDENTGGWGAKVKTRRTNRARILREKIEEYKSGKVCMDCGEATFLTFDHRDRKQKKFSLANLSAGHISNKQLEEEIAKCDLVCRKCHNKREKVRDYAGATRISGGRKYS